MSSHLWDPDWKPAFFFVTILRLRYLPFSKPTTVYLCDFNRDHKWTRWVRDHKNGLNKQQEQLLALLKACAWAPSAVDTSTLDVDAYYQQAVADLKRSSEWQLNHSVQSWLNSSWLCIPQVAMKLCFQMCLMLMYEYVHTNYVL